MLQQGVSFCFTTFVTSLEITLSIKDHPRYAIQLVKSSHEGSPASVQEACDKKGKTLDNTANNSV